MKFLGMIGTYEQRVVANTKVGKADIDTVAVNDSSKPYETAIASPEYNEGQWIVVELYDDKEAAKRGHQKWVNIMQDPPDQLCDAGDADLFFGLTAELINTTHKRKPNP